MNETSLSPIKAFNSILNKSIYSSEDYKRAQEFGLDIVQYISLSSFAKDALYKTSKQEIELFTDDNKYLFCEKGIRENISMASNHQVVANNPKCPVYNPNKPTTWLLYIDSNGLYTGSMMQSMPTEGHRYLEEKEIPELYNKLINCKIPDDASKGYMVEVDMEYPYKLHKDHTLYSLAPENLEIPKEEKSKYCQDLINDFKHFTKTKKLVPNLYNKKNYIVHYRALQCYIKLGIKLTKIHRAIEFNQSQWMKPFMEELARSRALATNDFEKNMYKLLRIDFVRPNSEAKKFKRLVADTTYKSHRILAENLDMAEMHEHFDFSNYPADHELVKNLPEDAWKKNNKVP
ncbi:4388_t:CDS:2, partial [Acaulospora colombiana]